jgi:hypothetical protein
MVRCLGIVRWSKVTTACFLGRSDMELSTPDGPAAGQSKLSVACQERSKRLASRSRICNGWDGELGGRLQELHRRKKHGKAEHIDPQENAPWERDGYHRVKKHGKSAKSNCPEQLV